MNNKIDTLDNELANDTNSIGFTGAVPIKNKKDLLLLDEEESKKEETTIEEDLDIDISGFLKEEEEIKVSSEYPDTKKENEVKEIEEIKEKDIPISKPKKETKAVENTDKLQGLVKSISLALIEECKNKKISVFNLSVTDLEPIWEYITEKIRRGD